MEKIAVIGGGAAGMMASIFAARRGMEVHVYEKNEKLDIFKLFCLQDKIDEELGLITIKKDDILDM